MLLGVKLTGEAFAQDAWGSSLVYTHRGGRNRHSAKGIEKKRKIFAACIL